MLEALRQLLSRQAGMAVIGTILILGTLVLLWAGRDVPVWLVGLDTAVVTAYFTASAAKNGQ